ncbi:hypothetical protein D0662_19640 [Salmonella enterica]|nr:hypothetical protein [Salmonella enterica]EBR9786910.1 hypothetical protein [Salmonella enterica subsp. enterica serovar Irumu]EBS5860640.1 hypothetical protein [Salmonella enterica subsp. enterica serovar Richmond]EDG9406234.1 hypothetical protein [Salmonella enterica subsp. enterica serovar Tennessee]
MNSVIITFSGFKSGTCQRYSGRVTVNKKARDDFGETVGSVLDTISSMPLIPPPIRAIIQAARDTVVSVARAVWNFFF